MSTVRDLSLSSSVGHPTKTIPLLQTKWLHGILLSTSLLLGLGGSTVLFGTAARSLDCPDPGIFVDPDTTTTAQIRVIEPPPDVDPGMARPSGTNCRAADPDDRSENELSELGVTRRPAPSR